MRHVHERYQSDPLSILVTLVTGLDEGEDDETLLNYLDTVGRHVLLADESGPWGVYVIVRIGDEEDGALCGKWVRAGSVTARNEVQAMSLAQQSQIGNVRDGMFAVRAAHWPFSTPAEVIQGLDLRLLKAQLKTLGAVSDPRTRHIHKKQRKHLEGVWNFLGRLHDALEAERNAKP
jgi:hypothetical protein